MQDKHKSDDLHESHHLNCTKTENFVGFRIHRKGVLTENNNKTGTWNHCNLGQ